MRDKLAKAIFTGVGLAGMLTGASNIYNNERNAQINQNMQMKELEHKKIILEFDKYRFEKELEWKRSSNPLTEIIERLESTSQSTKDNTLMNSPNTNNSNYKDIMTNLSPVSEEPKVLHIRDDTFSNIPSVLEWDEFFIDSNTHNMIHSLTYSYMCFSIATLLSTFNLVFNYLYLIYGDKLVEKLPKWVHPIYEFFKKYLLISITFDLFMIILFQFLSLTISIYFQIRGVQ